uniref:ORF2 n=1 Tax=Crocidura lasiura iflavirus 2 TaxID=3139468 RepID=A0AB38ZJS5_9VIRU
MAWLACWADDPLMSNFVAMRKHVSYFVYGDDVIINVSDVAAERFNNEFLQQFFAKYGIKYTDELKGEQIRKWCTLSESSFLKHHFIPHPCRSGIFTAGLDADSLYDTANWCHKRADLITASKQTTCDALMLAYGRGPDFFEEMRRKLITAWSNKVPGEPLTLYTYDEMDRIRFGYTLNYIIQDLDSAIKKEREYRASCKRQIELASGLTPIMFE